MADGIGHDGDPREQYPGDDPDAHLHDERRGEIRRGGAVGFDERDEPDGEEHGRGIVAARLQLQHRPQASAEADPARTQDREHRGGIGGRDDPAEQHPLQQAEAEDEARQPAEHHGAEEDADARQRDTRSEYRRDVAPAGAEASAEQDERQRDDPDGSGQLDVVELDPQHTLGAGEHPEDEEQQQARHAEPRRRLRQENAAEQQQRSEQDERLGRHEPR